MAVVHIDDRPFDVDSRRNLLDVCLSLGFDLPYFCWHPALQSVGACRQCAVKQFKDENDKRGRVVMACMTPAADGTRISIDHPDARDFRARVIEWLMVNHPHDCPVCEEGGECHLQDMTLMTGHVYRRYRFQKRTYRNQDLGPFLTHEMNRCIACYRCVRFYGDYAGGHDLNVFALRNRVYFGRHEDGPLENEFSGNLAEVCPTGVFTDKTLSLRYARKWDLQSAPSVCVHCGLGCNTSPNERYGELRRILNRYHSEINGYFLCDRGRFGYDFVNRDTRIRQPLLHLPESPALAAATRSEALQYMGSLLYRQEKVIGIGSPRASLEANFALRTLVGPDRFYLGLSESEHALLETILDILRSSPAPAPSLQEAEDADAVLILGEDVPETAPRLALSLRQAVRNASLELAEGLGIPRWQDASVRDAAQGLRSPLIVATAGATRLDDVATVTVRAAPDDIARLGFAVAHALTADAPVVPEASAELQARAGEIAAVLRAARRPLVVSGTGSGSDAVLRAAANVAWALQGQNRAARLCFAVPECNSLGLVLIGGGRLGAAFAAIEEGAADMAVILENDLYRRADARAVEDFLAHASHVIAIDHTLHPTAARAEIVLPAGTFAESDGTLVNNEGRAQRFFQVYVPNGEIQESWRWLRVLMTVAGDNAAESWHSLDDVMAACAHAIPTLARITEAAPSARFRIGGQKIARQTHRFSGRTANTAHITVHEPPPPADPDTPLSFSMEGHFGQAPAALVPIFWAPKWNSIQSVNKFQDEIGGRLRDGDAGARLIEPDDNARPGYFADVPPPFTPRPDAWQVVPLHHVFGSEELSALSPPVAARIPEPYLALHPADAAALGAEPGRLLELHLDRNTYRLPLRLAPSLARGLAGLPVGLAGLTGLALPAWGRIRAAKAP